MKNDVLSVIEAAYRIELGPEQWLNDVAQVVYEQIGRGLGMFGFSYRVTEDDQLRLDTSMQIGMPDGVGDGMTASLEAIPDWYVRETFASCGCDTSSRAGSKATKEFSKASMDALADAFGWRDIHILGGIDASRHGVYYGAWLPKAETLPKRTRETWSRVAIHLAAAHRLHRRLQSAKREEADAVLTPKGRLEHASGEAAANDARDLLGEGVREIERARGSLRKKDPDGAVASWRALIAGRWSLVDHFESDGKRYLLARRNEARVSGFEMLSDRERQAIGYAALGHNNKLIAYEMGIAPSTVSVLLTRGAKKLGTQTRDALVAQFLSASKKS